MSQDQSRREHIHVQSNPYRFQAVTWAPEKGGSGKVRFAVESMIYVSGVGLDACNPMTQGNEFMIALRNYIKMKEMIGYEHVGLSSQEFTNLISNMWGKEY